ncbi:MAG: NAD(P)/FAD-dependent oxidoreductase [Candidatus Dormibacteraeota bacterium]|nr:NAD(P)/FAD-dependent oxidoreductase [Candidatus Dormibacteraeota bacterium]
MAVGTATTETEVLIVGTGFAGLGTAIRLAQQGRRDFTIIERADDVGGTWRDNTYPGLICDVPSHLYSFSFAPNPDWSRTYPGQAEILRYLRVCADRYGVRRHIRFRSELTAARWDGASSRWHVETTTGSYNAHFLVLGMGAFSAPRMPAVPGLDIFAGTFFHSAAWRHDHDLRGERVAVIGTGASAIQFIPRIQPLVSRLLVLQRSPPWVLPHPGRRLTPAERWLSLRVPAVLHARRLGVYLIRETVVPGLVVDQRLNGGLEEVARRHLRHQVRDAGLRATLTPQYRLGCKRMVLSNDFYPSLTRANVDVVAAPVVEVRERSLVTGDGREHEVDTIIAATGFHVTDPPYAAQVAGRGGRTLAQTWDGSPNAYMATTVAGYPNLFVLSGPNSGIGHTSLVFMIEAQIDHVLDALDLCRRARLSSIEVRPAAQAAFNADVQRRMRRTVWANGGCASWYYDARGRNTTLWPAFTAQFAARARRIDVKAYRLTRSVAAAAA